MTCLRLDEVLEIVHIVLSLISLGCRSKLLHAGVVTVARACHLSMTVKDGRAALPHAVPHQEVVASLPVVLNGFFCPAESDVERIVDELTGERQRIVLVEYDDAVERIVLSDVACGDTVLAPDPAERI